MITAAPTSTEAEFLLICLNYDSAEAQKSDNYSNGGIQDAMDLFDHATKALNRQAAGGLLSSLKAKGFGHLDVEFDQFILSNDGIDYIFANLVSKK